MKNNARTQSKKNNSFKNVMDNNPLFGIYLGEVVDTKDLSRTGTIRVEIATLGKDAEFTSPQFNCRWTSPFAGSTNPNNIKEDGIEKYENTMKSYGMWMVPPDKGNLVLVAFANNNPKFPYVIACLYPDKLNHMVPGAPAGKNYSDPSLLMPVAEKNKFDSRFTHNDAIRPLHVDLAEGIVKQGLINDSLRGAGSSGARRESPSQVFGFMTPGPPDPENTQDRLGGHQFVLDDRIDSRMARLRTAGGQQLLMDDTTGIIYIINKNGSAWVELGTNGEIHVFSESSINMRAKGNFNLRADRNVNIEAGQNIQLKAAGDNITGRYVGVPGERDFNGPKGVGGNIRFEATADFTTLARQNIKLTAGGGEIETNSAGPTTMVSGQNGSQGFTINTKGDFRVKASGNGEFISSGDVLLAGTGSTHIGGNSIDLNSGTVSGLRSAASIKADIEAKIDLAPRLGTQVLNDAAATPAEFNREAAKKGKTAAPTGGKRTGSVDKIETIVSVMPTNEPFIGHSNFDPFAQIDAKIADPDPDLLAALPAGAADFSGKPVDVNSPNGFVAGLGFQSRGGETVSDFSDLYKSTLSDIGSVGSATIGFLKEQSANFAEAIPQYSDPLSVLNNFKSAAEINLVDIAAMGGIVKGIKGAIPSFRFPTITPGGAKVVGLTKLLTELEYQLGQFAVNAQATAINLNTTAIKEMRNTISRTLAATSSKGEFRTELVRQGVRVIDDSPGVIYRDRNGNNIVDVSNGIGPIGESLGFIADTNNVWNAVRNSITSEVTENQIVSLASFAQSIGTEAFLSSNVLDAVNKGNYRDVPKLMRMWAYSDNGTGPTLNAALDGRRAWEGAIWQTPDGADITVNINDVGPGELTFQQLAEVVNNNRALYIRKVVSNSI